MRVLAAGASGAIGRRLVPQPIAAGHDVVATTRRLADDTDPRLLQRQGQARARLGASLAEPAGGGRYDRGCPPERSE